MSYKPDEKEWMAYLYGELEGEEKDRVERYLQNDAEARKEFESFRNLRGMLASVEDKEVIAPPIFVGETRQRFFWNTPYFNTIVSIAASLLLIILIGKLTGTSIRVSGNELRMSFGETTSAPDTVTPQQHVPATENLTATDVQEMINASLHASLNEHRSAMQASLNDSQDKLNASIRKNLDLNSGRIDQLMRQAAAASQEQVRLYVTSLQAENLSQVKDYFQLTSNEQKKYIEDILVDFADYLQQQRSNDLQLVQTRLQSLEQNTNIFQQETEQILTSIITTVGNQEGTEIKN